MCLQDAILSVRRSLRDLRDPVRSTCHIFSDSTILATFHLLINYIVPLVMICIGSIFMETKHCPKEMIAQLLIIGGMGRILCTLAKNLILAKPEEDGARSRPYLRVIRGLLDLLWITWFIASCIMVYRLNSHVSFVKTCPDPKVKCKDPSNSNYCNKTLFLFSFWLLNSIFIFGGACGFTMVCGYYFPWLVGKKYMAGNSNSTSNPSATSTSIQYTRAGTGAVVPEIQQPIVNNPFSTWV